MQLYYDPVAIAASYRQRPLSVWGRGFTVVLTFLSFIISLGWDWVRGRIVQNQQLRASILRQKLIQLGPTFIKLGQILSCRPDLIPPIYVEEFANLQDKLPPFPNQEAYQIIAEELGCSYDQIYAELSPQPVAAASLGQVYKGKLKTGEIVAVKVQRPNLLESISLDIYLLRKLAAWAQNNIPYIHSDLVALSDELAARLFEETDYINEGNNAQRFAKLYGDLTDIYVPGIYFEYTGRRVLTMEWVDGVKLTSIEAILQQGLNPDNLVAVGFNCSLRQLLQGGFFHADPHPGNVLVTPEGKVVYLDFGMMSEISPEQRDRLIISLIHLIAGDFEGLAQDYVSLGFLPPETDTTPLVPIFANVFGDIREASVAEFGFKQSLDKLFALIYEYDFQAPSYYLLIFRCFATLEGIALKVNPSFKAFKSGYPYAAQWLLTAQSPLLRDCLKDFIFKNNTIQWEQVHDLLENARISDDFELNQLLAQALDFLYCPQGELLRQALVVEAVTGLENLSQNTFDSLMAGMGLRVTPFPLAGKKSPNLDDLQRIADTFQQIPAFKSTSIYDVFKLFLKPETQRLTQEITEELWKRFLSRIKDCS